MTEWNVKKEYNPAEREMSISQAPEEQRWKVKQVHDPKEGVNWERMAYETTGGAVGGAIASPGVLTTPIGVGLGAAAGGQIYDFKEAIFGGKKKSVAESATDVAYDFGLNAVSPIALEKGVYAGKQLLKSIVDKPVSKMFRPSEMALYSKYGLKPTAATATQSKSLMVAENALADFPISAGVMRENAQYNIAQLDFANKFLASEYGDILTKEEVGSLLKGAAPKALDKLSKTYDKLFTRVSQQIGNNPQTIDNTIDALNTFYAEAKTGPVTGVTKIAEDIFNKAAANKGGLPFESLKKYRSYIGELMKDPTLISTRNIQSGDLKRLYGALTKDMEIAAKNSGSKVHASWRAANKYFESSLENKVPILEEIMKKGYDEDVYNIISNASSKGGSKLWALRKQMPTEEWGNVAGTILGKMGSSTAAAQNAVGSRFSVATYLTNWNKLAPEAKRVLFNGTKYDELAQNLDEFASVIGDFKSVEEIANKSKTGSVLMFFSLFQTLGGLAGGVASGGSGAIGGLAAGTTLGLTPYYTAKLLTNPGFVKWLSKGVQIAKNNPTDMSMHLGRLFVMKETEDVSDAINEFMKGVISDGEQVTPQNESNESKVGSATRKPLSEY